jgi:hypothetical protein
MWMLHNISFGLGIVEQQVNRKCLCECYMAIYDWNYQLTSAKENVYVNVTLLAMVGTVE